MYEYSEKLLTLSSVFLHDTGVFLNPLLENLDPSLFQNIILGILAIFIPFAIVYLTDILGTKKESSEFEKMVLSEEVLGAKKIFWISVLGLGALSFFTGKDIAVTLKIVSTLLTVILVLFYGRFFKKILRFSEGYRPEFKISFLRKLRFSKLFRYRNKLKAEKMVRAWGSFWSESTVNEREFTQLFIQHVDDTIAHNQYNKTVALAQTYQTNIDKRDRFSVGYEILPKLFEWHESFWVTQQDWLFKKHYVQEVSERISAKHFPTFKVWVSYLVNLISPKSDFWNWHYFMNQLFPETSKILLHDYHNPYQLFTGLKKYIDESIVKLDAIEEEEERQRWWNHIKVVLGSFFPTFFDNINTVPNNYEVWEHNFPGEWKISSSNSDNRISRLLLYEFIQWSKDRLVAKNEGSERDQDVTEVVNGIFPNVHHRLFPSFVMLFLTSEVKFVIEKEPNFFIVNTGLSWSGEKSDEEIEQMLNQQELSRKEETLDIIFQYFAPYWSLLKIYKEDLTEEQSELWGQYSEAQRKKAVVEVRTKKLQNAMEGLLSQEIIELCTVSEQKEQRRLDTIELLELMISTVPHR